MQQRLSQSIAIASLLLAVVAYYPSAAAFTPAIVLSFVAAVGAFVTACLGFVRLAIVTLSVVLATALISPWFFPSFAERGTVPVMLFSALGVAIVGFALLCNSRKRRAKA